MIRSYALTLAAVTLRLYIPAALISGFSFEAAYPAISWLCWVPNLIVAEWIIRRHAARSTRLTASRIASGSMLVGIGPIDYAQAARKEAMSEENRAPMRRRDLLALIGAASGGATMYQAMTTLGFAAESPYAGPIRLDGDPKGASVLVLGAGLAGLVAALELRRAGYRVQVLESEPRAGGRCWTIRGGDRITDIDGASQTCAFDQGQYFNPGPWRIPHHHKAILDYCKRFGVALEPFIQVNHNAYVHARGAFGGRPQRFRHVQSDFNGHVAELLAKATNQNRLDDRGHAPRTRSGCSKRCGSGAGSTTTTPM